MDKRGGRSRWDSLTPYNREGNLNVVIETPQGSRNKFKFDPDVGVFRLNRVLPAGMNFPYDFGYIPGTLADDGDPLDLLLLMDAPVFPGCLVYARAIGVIEGRQWDHTKKRERNDRLIGVASDSERHRDLHVLRDLPPHLVAQIEQFFVTYHRERGEVFKPIGRRGPKHAAALVEQGIAQASKKRKRESRGR